MRDHDVYTDLYYQQFSLNGARFRQYKWLMALEIGEYYKQKCKKFTFLDARFYKSGQLRGENRGARGLQFEIC